MTAPKTGLLLFLTMTWCAEFVTGQTGTDKNVTFNNVAPIFYRSCAGCHRHNDIAPMSLMTYKEVRPWAAAIRQAVAQRVMPPWHADPNVGEFINHLRLSENEIATIEAWATSGAKEGDPQDLPPAPVFHDGWHIQPDLVLTIPETTVAAGNQDDYEYIYVPTNSTEDRWIQAAEVVPGDRRVVHHATVSVVAAGKVPKLREDHANATEGEDKYHYRTGKVLHLRPDAPVLDDGCLAPEGGGFPGEKSGYINIVPAIYLPGHLAETRPPGSALKIPVGSYLGCVANSLTKVERIAACFPVGSGGETEHAFNESDLFGNVAFC